MLWLLRLGISSMRTILRGLLLLVLGSNVIGCDLLNESEGYLSARVRKSWNLRARD